MAGHTTYFTEVLRKRGSWSLALLEPSPIRRFKWRLNKHSVKPNSCQLLYVLVMIGTIYTNPCIKRWFIKIYKEKKAAVLTLRRLEIFRDFQTVALKPCGQMSRTFSTPLLYLCTIRYDISSIWTYIYIYLYIMNRWIKNKLLYLNSVFLSRFSSSCRHGVDTNTAEHGKDAIHQATITHRFSIFTCRYTWAKVSHTASSNVAETAKDSVLPFVCHFDVCSWVSCA